MMGMLCVKMFGTDPLFGPVWHQHEDVRYDSRYAVYLIHISTASLACFNVTLGISMSQQP